MNCGASINRELRLKTFLRKARQREAEFLHSWELVFPKVWENRLYKSKDT